MPDYQIEIANRQDSLPCDEAMLRAVLKDVVRSESSVQVVHLSVAVLDDTQTRQVNAEFLDREGITDVISFPYDAGGDHLAGEIVVNADEAIRQANRAGHEAWDELLLYAVHGVLHLLGYEDSTPEFRSPMNRRAV